MSFQANWKDILDSKCFSKSVLVLTNQINSGKTRVALHLSFIKWLTLISPGMCMRYCYCYGPAISTVGCTDETKDKTAAESHLRPRSHHRGTEHRSGRYNF